MSFSDVTPGTPIIASNVQQVIDALKGTAGKGVPLTVSAVNDSARYALTLENTEATNSRALNVLKNDGSVLIRADATGVTLGQPLNLPTGSVTSTAILDGTIATADLANNAVTNAKLGTDTARLNLLTNGGFEIWQRGNGPFTSSIGPDRWGIFISGSDTLSVSRDAVNIDAYGSACAAATFTLSGGGGLSRLYQNLKLTDIQLQGATLTFSVRVRTSTANAVRIGVDTQTPGDNFVYSGFHTGNGTYQTLQVTAPWIAGTSIIQPFISFSVSCTAYIDNAMLVVGSVAADYAPLHPADDLARCQRYYQKHQNINTRWYAQTTSITQEVVLPLRAVLAVAPTVTLTPGTRTNIAAGYPQNRYTQVDGVAYMYAPTATGDTYALNDIYVLEANP